MLSFLLASSGPEPQRFAQAALGHSIKAVHEAYARDAVVICPSMGAYENREPENLIAIPMTAKVAGQFSHAAAS